MDASKTMKTFGGMEVYDEAARMQINGIKTAGTGAAYTATVKAIDTLTAGVGFVMVPHTVSTSNAPTLNVNNLGAKIIRLRLSSSMKSTITLPNDDFIASGYPIKVVYDGSQWIIEDMVYPNAKGLYGTVPIKNGGTGADTVAGARNALGLGNTDGALPIANGGTGATTATAARIALGLAGDDTGTVDISVGGTGATNAADARTNLKITPANIGAAASSHNHSAANITSGTLPIARGGTGATTAVNALKALGITMGTSDAPTTGTANTIYIKLL